MAAPTVEDVLEFLQARQRGTNTAINLVGELARNGDKYKAGEKTALLADIIAGLGQEDPLANAARFAGARRPAA